MTMTTYNRPLRPVRTGLAFMAKSQSNYILSPSQIAEIIWLYEERGLSPYRIAKIRNRKTGRRRFPVSPNTIRYHLKRQERRGILSLRGRREAARKHKFDTDKLIKMYLLPPKGKGLSTCAIAKSLSSSRGYRISPATVYTVLRDAGIKMRTYEEAKRLESMRSKQGSSSSSRT